MVIYDVIKDGVKVARDAGNIDLSLKLAAVADDLLEKQRKIEMLEDENKKLRKMKKYKYAGGHSWKIDPENPSLMLCPTCLNRDNFENPMIPDGNRAYCFTCKKEFK